MLFLLPAAARADLDPETRRETAIRLGHEAAEAYRLGRYDEALTKYQEAYRLVPAPPLVLNLSRTERKLGHCDQALEYADIYAAAFSQSATASTDSPEVWLASVKAECPEIDFTSEPAGAELLIDGVRPPSAPVTPWNGRLPVGKHTAVAKLAGYPDQRVELVVTANTLVRVGFTFFNPSEAAGTAPMPPTFRSEAAAAPRPPSTLPRWSPWIPAAVALAGAGLAIGEGVAASQCSGFLSPFGGAAANPCQTNRAAAADAGWGMAGAGAVTAGVLWILIAAGVPSAAAPRPVQVGFLGNGVQATGTF